MPTFVVCTKAFCRANSVRQSLTWRRSKMVRPFIAEISSLDQPFSRRVCAATSMYSTPETLREISGTRQERKSRGVYYADQEHGRHIRRCVCASVGHVEWRFTLIASRRSQPPTLTSRARMDESEAVARRRARFMLRLPSVLKAAISTLR